MLPTLLMDPLNLLLCLPRSLRLTPYLPPFQVRRRRRARANHLKHVLRRVLLLVDLAPAVLLKVVDEGRCVLAEVAKVHSLAALLEEEEAVELLEELGGGLMNAERAS